MTKNSNLSEMAADAKTLSGNSIKPQDPLYRATHFSPTERLLSFRQVQERYFLGSKTRWYELMAMGEAPRPIKVSWQRVAWLESEVLAWLNARIAKRNEQATIRAEG